MIAEMANTWEPTATFLLTALIAPLAIGISAGLFARNTLRWVLIVVVLAGITGAVLAVGGLLQIDAARTMLDSIYQMVSTAVDAAQRCLTSSPVPGAALLTGLAIGLCVREAWRRTQKGAEC
jgi:uncharacterized membrane protein (Fun14 family)